MTRTIQEIQNQIAADIAARPALAGLNSTSKLSIWSLLAFVVATAVWTLEQLFDLHLFEVEASLSAQKAHRPRWYEEKALAFQLGYDLVPEEDYYDNTGLSTAAVEASRIIKHASAIEVTKGLRIKLATESGGDLSQLSAPQLTAVKAYLNEIKDGGVKLYPESLPPDNLKLALKVYYNPLILDSDGARLDGTAATPVQDAVNTFLKANPFNSLFVPMALVDVLQKVDGVVIPHVASAWTQYGTRPFALIEAAYQPDGGYLRFADPEDLVIAFLPHAPL